MMERHAAYTNAYKNSVIVKKLMAGATWFIVTDKNGTIQRFAQPVRNPPQSEIKAGLEIRRRLAPYPLVASSAQTFELNVDAATYARSKARGGLTRPVPK